ncbi:MAG: T9SS type A sorting domain-containing protein [Saprospiraceae bacterium]|nr:T9SS type A sorting domain-containing protein [Saprospiraceae bacterium]
MKNITLILCLFMAFSAQGQALLSEDFNYTDSLTKQGWTPVSAWGTNGLYARATGLTHTGYANSGIGNAVDMVASGEDSKKDFTSAVTSGSLYASFLMNLKTAAKTAGSYVTGFTSGASGSNYNLRFYVKSDSAGGFYLGIGRGTAAATYSTNRYTANTAYLVTIKYGFNTTATTNDTVAFYVHPTASTTTIEPAISAYTVNNLASLATGSDATEINAFFLRQGTASDSITLTMDGIRVATTWAGSVLKTSSTQQIEKSAFRVYPSVTRGLVTLSFDKVGEKAVVSVVNVQGQVVLSKKYDNTEGDQNLDLSLLPNGTYIVRLVSEQGFVTQTIEKQ